MKILYIQDSLGTGGAERSNAELWYYLRKKSDVQLKIVVLEHRKVGIEKEIIEAGFDVIFLKNQNFLKQVSQIRNIIKSFNPDIVHSVLFRSAIRVRSARFFTKFCHLESLVNCSYSPIRYQDPKINNTGLTIYKYINRLTQSSGTDKFIAITNEVKNHGIEYLNIPSNKIEVIPRGREENGFINKKTQLSQNLRKELFINDNGPIFIHVGRQEYQKGHLELLKAIKLKEKELQDLECHFIFCGREGNATEELQEYIRSKDLKMDIHWLGHRDDIKSLLPASNIFIFPSLFEGLGGSLIEAQAAGLPVICSNIQVFEEVVNNGENALMYKLGDEKDLADKMLELSRSKKKQKFMGEKSLENFKEKFQIEDIHKMMLNLYKGIVE